MKQLNNSETENLPFPKNMAFLWSELISYLFLDEMLTICTVPSFQKRKIDVEPTQSVIALPFAVAFVFLAYNYDAVRNFSMFNLPLATSHRHRLQISLLANWLTSIPTEFQGEWKLINSLDLLNTRSKILRRSLIHCFDFTLFLWGVGFRQN